MFQSISKLNVSANNGKQLISDLNNPDILIVLNSRQTFQNGDLLERNFKSGYTFSVRWIQNEIKGNLIALNYGESEILFDIPSPLEPFNLELIPNRLQFEYSVEIFTRVFNPIYNVLENKLGIPLNLISRIPQQTLQFLLGIDMSKSADTRNIIQALETQGATIAQQGTTITSQQAALDAANAKLGTVETELVTVKTESIISEEFIVAQSDFSLVNGRWIAPKLLEFCNGSKSVQMSCVDNDGDEQGFSQLIHPYMGDIQKVAVELSPSQYNEGSFPLKFLVQGNRKVSQGPTSPGLDGEQIPGMSYMARFNRGNSSIERSEDGGATWVGLGNGDAENIAQAVIETNTGLIHVVGLDGSYNYGAINSTEWSVSNSGNFAGLLSDPVNIVL